MGKTESWYLMYLSAHSKFVCFAVASSALAGKREATHCSFTKRPESTSQTRDSQQRLTRPYARLLKNRNSTISISIAIHGTKSCLLNQASLGAQFCFWGHPAAHCGLQRTGPSTALSPHFSMDRRNTVGSRGRLGKPC